MNALDAIKKLRGGATTPTSPAPAAAAADGEADPAPPQPSPLKPAQHPPIPEDPDDTYAGVEAVHSGGQTGADMGGLAAAVELGLGTGGWIPKGFKTEAGPAPELADLGLRETPEDRYGPRTFLNVRETDGTVLFGDSTSSGSRLTLDYCRDALKPTFLVGWRSGVQFTSEEQKQHVDGFREWLKAYRVRVLNVAGNRESVQPGIEAMVRAFLVEALS